VLIVASGDVMHILAASTGKRRTQGSTGPVASMKRQHRRWRPLPASWWTCRDIGTFRMRHRSRPLRPASVPGRTGCGFRRGHPRARGRLRHGLFPWPEVPAVHPRCPMSRQTRRTC